MYLESQETWSGWLSERKQPQVTALPGPEEVMQDEEGVAIMRTLGHNMAWLLKCIEAGKAAGIPLPQREAPLRTNFIR